MEQIKKSISIFIGLLFFCTCFAHAKENSLLVDLPQKINQSFANIEQIGQDHDQQIKNKEAEIEKVITQLHQTEDDNQIYNIQKEYMALRAENLKSQAERLVKIENELTSVVYNMDRLEQACNDSQKFGIGAGINKNDAVSKKSVKGMLKGFKSILEMVETLNPNANLSNSEDTFATMNSMAKTFFTGSSNISMAKQKNFVLESLTLSKSIQGLLGVEHDYLLTRLYYIDSSHIIKQFGKIKVAILGNGIKVNDGIKKWHKKDEEVFRYGSANGFEDQHSINTNYKLADVDW